jgi:ubiquinone/menaquinone biosynthesis C-methylase UbiE
VALDRFLPPKVNWQMTDVTATLSLTEAAGAWSRYWDKGSLHSCPGAFAANYNDEILVFWNNFFSDLSNGARVLDIGTGNGAVAFLARDAALALGYQFHIEGIDAAIIQPAEAAAKHGLTADGVRFRGLTNAEQTGYPTASCDAVSSQYAIEYMDVNACLQEISRILKPAGKAAVLMHHADSEAVTTTRAELKVLDYLRQEAPLLQSAFRLLNRLEEFGKTHDPGLIMQDTESRKQMKDIEKLLKKVAQYARSRPHAGFAEGIAMQVAGVLQRTPTSGAGSALASLRMLEQEMKAHQTRLKSMLKAGLDEQGIAEFCQLAGNNGLTPAAPEILYRNNKDLLGWTLILHREQ